MKFVLFGFLLLGISSCALANEAVHPVYSHRLTGIPDIISNLIKSVFDALRKAIPDPLEIVKIGSHFNSTAVNGSFEIDDFLETGCKKFEITAAKVGLLHPDLNLVINVPRININANYMTDLLFGKILPWYGRGPFNIHLKDLEFNISAKYSYKIFENKLSIKNTSFVTTLSEATFDIHGLIDNEAFSILVSQIFDDTFKEFINRHTRLISKIASPIVESVLNAILNHKKKPTEAPPTVSPDTEVPTDAPTDAPTDVPTDVPETTASSSTEPDVDPSEIPDLLNLDYSEMIDQDAVKELGSNFLQSLKKHPDVAKLFMF